MPWPDIHGLGRLNSRGERKAALSTLSVSSSSRQYARGERVTYLVYCVRYYEPSVCAWRERRSVGSSMDLDGQ